MSSLPAAPVIRTIQRLCAFNPDNIICLWDALPLQIQLKLLFFSLTEIIDYLYEKNLPELETKLKKEEEKHKGFSNLPASQQQRAFRFCDIFDFSEDSDSSEDSD